LTEPIAYRDFGESFVCSAVTPERIVDAVRRIAGDTVELGPLKAGPGGKATVRARGTLGEPAADEVGSDPLVYEVTVPVDVSLEVKVGAVGHFDATGRIPLRLAVQTVQPLGISIEVTRVRPADISFEVSARGVQSKLLQHAGDVEGELRRHTADYVNSRIADPATARFTRIDILPLIDQVWSSL
jgi:hypothetical protein